MGPMALNVKAINYLYGKLSATFVGDQSSNAKLLAMVCCQKNILNQRKAWDGRVAKAFFRCTQ